MTKAGDKDPGKGAANSGKSAGVAKKAAASKAAPSGKAKGGDKSMALPVNADGELVKFTHGESFADGSTFEEGLGRVSNLDVENEMEDSFIAYAMSVIVSRALPDAKDGLKPVQRRILYSAYEMGLRPERTHVKSARIIGECFAAGTKVLVRGGVGNIEDINVGDFVIGGDGSEVRVVRAYTNPSGAMLLVLLEDGKSVLATPGQLFRVKDPDPAYPVIWAAASGVAGREVATYVDGVVSFSKCLAVTAVEDAVNYDIEVESKEHSFIANGMVVHNCMGKLHPHGDLAIYEALVRMAQEWSLNLPLINPQGNFGSRDDGPAASRYCVVGDTDVRMADGTSVAIRDLAGAVLPPDSEVDLDVHVLDKDGRPVHASKLFNSGVHPIKKVIASNGESISGSSNHLLLCLVAIAGVPIFQWLELGDITPGMVVATVQPINSVSEDASKSLGQVPFVREYVLSEVSAEQGSLLTRERFDIGALWGEQRESVARAINNSEVSGVLSSVMDRGYEFAEVVDVQDLPAEEVYSIRVDSEDHSFLAGGFVNHNTEARLSKPALDIIDEIDEDTVDFRPTYDDSGTEPVVLPAGFPNLLVNGATGIAVGMATNMPPHNLIEVVSVLRAMLADEKITDQRLMEMIPAPDFPTGGVIVGIDGVREAFLTGRGAFKLRSVATITDVTARKKGIVVTELPYTVGPEQVIKSIKDAVSDKKLLGIADVNDYSDRRTGLKLVIEAKAGYDPEVLLAELWATTPLQVNFSVNNVALVDGAPQTLSLRELCDVYLTHRIDVVSRRTGHRLKKASERAHIISGLVTALSSIERVVQIIRGSKDTESARKALMKELALDEIQCAAILEMTLRRLTGLEVNKLKAELKELEASIKHLSAILGSKKKLRDLVSAELGEVVARHGAPRRSKILAVDDTVAKVGRSAGAPVNAGMKCAITLGVDGKLTRYLGDSAYGDLVTGASSAKGGKSGKTGKAGVKQIIDTSTAALLAGITSAGRVIHFHGSDVPEAATAAKAVVSMSANEELIGIGTLDERVLTLVTERGVIKRIKGSDLPRKSGNAAIKLGERDHLVAAFLGAEDDKWDVFMITSDAQLLRTALAAVRTTGASSAGVAGMKVGEDAKIICAFAGDGDELLVTIANSGKAKVTKIGEYPAKGRNGGGVRCQTLRKGETSLIAAGVIPVGYVGVASGSSGNFLIDASSLGKRDGGGDQMIDPGVNGIGFALK